MKIQRITTVLVVETIESVLPLWRDALGFSVVADVKEGDALGFVLLAKDDQHVMLQTRASVENDCPAVLGALRGPASSVLYVDVSSLDACMKAMKGAELLVGPRTTFYGAREAFYRTASGHVVGFAEEAKGK